MRIDVLTTFPEMFAAEAPGAMAVSIPGRARRAGLLERVIEKLRPLEVSVGDYVLSGGELGAMVLIDAVTRLIPGVLGDDDSAGQDSFGFAPVTDPDGVAIEPRLVRKWAAELGLTITEREAIAERLLDCPHYTRPRVWEGMEVPEVLTSGDHRAVARWRLEQMVARTRERRPDLLGD
jgi:tRNA (guanine37-N1)-methyltransferase